MYELIYTGYFDPARAANKKTDGVRKTTINA